MVEKLYGRNLRSNESNPRRASQPDESLIVPAQSEKQVARFIALQEELKAWGEALSRHRPETSPPLHGFLDGQAPQALIKSRASRYRMPRKLKQELIDRFVSGISSEKPKVMIIAAHQDDESIGAGGQLCTVSDAWVVHVTDGAPADPGVALRYGFATRDEYAEARRKELNAALDVAGVLPEHRLCLNYVDGQASLVMVDLVLRLADLIDSIKPDIIITHPYEGGHTDHDATAFAVHLACGLLRREGLKPPALLEMTSYYRRESRRVVHDFLPHKRADKGQRTVHLDQEQQERKREMYDCFATQRQVLRNFATEMEKFRPAPRYNFTRPPHEGQLNYERFGEPYRGHRWRRDAEEALARLSMRKTVSA